MCYREVPHLKHKFDQLSAMTWKRRKTGCILVLITNRKSHMGFRLAPKSVTLNDVERYFALFYEFGSFGTDYVRVVEDRTILSEEKM